MIRTDRIRDLFTPDPGCTGGASSDSARIGGALTIDRSLDDLPVGNLLVGGALTGGTLVGVRSTGAT